MYISIERHFRKGYDKGANGLHRLGSFQPIISHCHWYAASYWVTLKKDVALCAVSVDSFNRFVFLEASRKF